MLALLREEGRFADAGTSAVDVALEALQCVWDSDGGVAAGEARSAVVAGWRGWEGRVGGGGGEFRRGLGE